MSKRLRPATWMVLAWLFPPVLFWRCYRERCWFQLTYPLDEQHRYALSLGAHTQRQEYDSLRAACVEGMAQLCQIVAENDRAVADFLLRGKREG